MNPIEDPQYFRLPITYLDASSCHTLAPTVINDLELTQTIYPILLNPETTSDKAFIGRLQKHYSSDISFLKQSQQVLQEYTIKPVQKYSVSGTESLLDIWFDVYEKHGFVDRYGFISWDQIRFINRMESFMGYWTIMNLLSPIFSILLPFFFLIAPFFIMKIKSIPISFTTYLDLLKDMAKSHAIGKTLTSIENFSIHNFLYLIFTVFMYGLQMYQNCMHCKRFHNNISTVNNNLLELKTFIDHSIQNMSAYAVCCGDKPLFKGFADDLQQRLETLNEIKHELSSVKPFTMSVGKCFEVGYLLKSYYAIFDTPEYKNAIGYALSFEAYSSSLCSVSRHINKGSMNYGEFGESTKFRQQIYPTVLEGGVANDLSIQRFSEKNTYRNMIITGPNASGKTTQLKTTAINVILSQQLGVGFYQAAIINPYQQIHSYLNIPDTSGRDSLFQAEARRCKEILDNISDGGDRHFCIFDELFSGTNSEEATMASYGFLAYLQKHANVDFILTTHFSRLCKKVRDLRIANYKMEATITEDDRDISFTYKLLPGINKIKAARLILIQMGFPEEIIEASKQQISNLIEKSQP